MKKRFTLFISPTPTFRETGFRFPESGIDLVFNCQPTADSNFTPQKTLGQALTIFKTTFDRFESATFQVVSIHAPVKGATVIAVTIYKMYSYNVIIANKMSREY